MGFLRKLLAWGTLGIAAAVLVFFALPTYRQGEASIAGKNAPDFPMTLNGKPGHLSDLRGFDGVELRRLHGGQPAAHYAHHDQNQR